MAKRDKPLVRAQSPWTQYINVQSLSTMMLSILHRITGVALSVGSILLVYWLFSAASGPEQYANAVALIAMPWMQILVIGWLFSFCYHFLNGIRHLVWDTGRGFDIKVARTSGYTVLVTAFIATAALYWLFCARLGGAA